MNTDYIKKWLSENLDEERYLHSLGTADMAKNLAKRYGLNAEKAYLAGLLHDCAKCESNEKLLNIIKSQIKDVDPTELKNYKTFHAPVSALYAKEKFMVDDNEILSAIKAHTLGKLNMTPFEMIIFLSDKIETKTRAPHLTNEILKILDENEGVMGLKLALLSSFERTIISLVDRKLLICPITIEVYNELLEYKNCL